MEWQIETWTAGQMSEAEFVAACALHHAAFPKAGRTLADVVAKKRPTWMAPDATAQTPRQVALGVAARGPLFSDEPPRRYAVRDAAGRWLGNAGVLTRTLQTTRGPLQVLGLMDVATLPETRGMGLGKRLVRAAWAEVDAGRVAACLLKTSGASPFYEKLGARVIDNPLVNSLAEGGVDRQPFEESAAMIYPAQADWPTGEIDLRGPAF
ncbi:MAG: GNAT family N-acetyltransferase [Planctomycetota bacterium]